MISRHGFQLRERVTYDDPSKLQLLDNTNGDLEEEKKSAGLNLSNGDFTLLSREMPCLSNPFGLPNIPDNQSDSESELARVLSDEQQRPSIGRQLLSTDSWRSRPSAVSRTSPSFVVFQRGDDQIGISDGLLSQSIL